MILLVTDGESYDLEGDNAEIIAKEMRDNNITVFAIIIGMDRIQDEIVTITHTTGGEAFEAGDPDALKAIFKRIDKMKQAPWKRPSRTRWMIFGPAARRAWGCSACVGCPRLACRYTPW